MSNNKRHAIIAASDHNCGDFLIQHWYRSLAENVDLRDVDVIVLDYGLTKAQRVELDRQRVEYRPSIKNGWICLCCLRDTAMLLAERSYDQVLHVDGGDVIFQADIRPQFDEHKNSFRAVCEEIDTSRHELFMRHDDFDPVMFKEINCFLLGKPIINFGVLFGPATAFCDLWEQCCQLLRDQNCYGSDQMAINYWLYKNGFVQLDSQYNFIPLTTRRSYDIRDGVFLNEQGEPIPIVHNAGQTNWIRTIEQFGYGPNCNRRKTVTPFLLRSMFHVINTTKGLLRSQPVSATRETSQDRQRRAA